MEAPFDFPDTALVSESPKTSQEYERAPGKTLSIDIVVYLTIVALVGLTWQVSQMGLFKAGDDTGYWIGVAGGVMMLLLFSYPMRKYLRFTRNWGRVKWWFLEHGLPGLPPFCVATCTRESISFQVRNQTAMLPTSTKRETRLAIRQS